MNEVPDQSIDDAAAPRTDGQQDNGTRVRINATDPERVRADTDPQSTTTQVFASEYQKVLPER
jgi:hypothetical protein